MVQWLRKCDKQTNFFVQEISKACKNRQLYDETILCAKLLASQ